VCSTGWEDTSEGNHRNTEADTKDHYLGRNTGIHDILIIQVEEWHDGVTCLMHSTQLGQDT
jgi:hypothetical protein